MNNENIFNDNQPMIIESYDNIEGFSSYINYSNINNIVNNDNNFSNIVNNIGTYISNDIINKEEPFLKDLLNTYDKNLEDLFLKVNIDNLNEIVNKYIKNNKKIDVNYHNSFTELSLELKNEFKINFSITDDVNNIKNILKETIDNMLKLENELDLLLDKYNKNKKTILNVQNTYKDEKNKKLLNEFENIFDKLNNNFIEDNKIEDKLKKYIENGIQLNILLKIVNDIKSLMNGHNTCTICLNNQINKVLIPCGHTFCEDCLKKNDIHHRNNLNNNIKCPICRKDIVSENNLYII